MEQNLIHGASFTYGRERKCIQDLDGEPEQMDCSEHLGVDGTVPKRK